MCYQSPSILSQNNSCNFNLTKKNYKKWRHVSGRPVLPTLCMPTTVTRQLKRIQQGGRLLNRDRRRRRRRTTTTRTRTRTRTRIRTRTRKRRRTRRRRRRRMLNCTGWLHKADKWNMNPAQAEAVRNSTGEIEVVVIWRCIMCCDWPNSVEEKGRGSLTENSRVRWNRCKVEMLLPVWKTGVNTVWLEMLVLCSFGERRVNEYGAMVECYWQGKTEVLGEKHYTTWVVCGWMSMEQWWNDTDRGKLKYWERNIIQRGW